MLGIKGKLGEKEVYALEGQFHFYEGYSMKEVCYPFYVLKLLGVEQVVLTNACGGINREFAPGTLMLLTDFINMMGTNPLIGPNDERFGPRFPDMTEPYSLELRNLAKQTADELGIFYQEGVYLGFREALLIQRAGVTVIVNNGYNWRLRQRFVVLPIFVVHIGHAIPPYNIAVLGLGGAHCINGLLFGQTIERQPRPVAKCANDAPRSKKFGFTHKNTSILNI